MTILVPFVTVLAGVGLGLLTARAALTGVLILTFGRSPLAKEARVRPGSA